MAQFKFKFLQASAALGLLTATGGCANMDSFRATLDEEWNQPSISVTPKETPSDPEAALLRAEMKAGQLEDYSPEADCEKILAIAPEIIAHTENPENAELKLAHCQYTGFDYAGARKSYQSAYDRSGNPEALKGLALTELRDGRRSTALDLLSRLDSPEGPVDWQVLNAIGYANDLSGDFAAAEAAYTRAVEGSPGKAAPLNNLGMSYLRQDRPLEAINAFRRALDREPSLPVTRLNLRIALAASGDFAVALAGASEEEQASVLNSLGTQALARGEIDKARSLFQRALEKSPSFYANAYENLERTQLLSEQ